MEIKISKANKLCKASETPFCHGDAVVSLVRLLEGHLVREDYKEHTWAEHFRNGAYSVWRTEFYDPEAAEGKTEEQFSPLRKIFYDAAETESRQELAVAFLAAQLLRRQKVFRMMKEADAEEGQTRLTLYTDRVGNRLIEVRDPNFSYAELENARTELMARLRALEEPEGLSDASVDENQESCEEQSAEDSDDSKNALALEDSSEDSDGENDDEDEYDDDDDEEDDEDDEEEE